MVEVARRFPGRQGCRTDLPLLYGDPSPAQIHFAIRRLRRKAPAAIILIALLGATSAVEDEEVVQTLVKLDLIKSTLHATVERILRDCGGCGYGRCFAAGRLFDNHQ